MYGSLPKACPHSGPVPLRPHTPHSARELTILRGNTTQSFVSSQVAERHTSDWWVWVRAPVVGSVCSFGVAALSFVLWHILFAAFLCARLQLLCFAFLFFYVCSLRVYVFYVRHNISANRAGVIRFCCR